ncbi:hypothetical protein L3X38_036624 [Prunus dulcis]|uniref:Uncharacterized protein n=1 Tax=Prunus dulcis TaxID=3755 RepID=A0AAD4V3K2_PRUDU|nr:hypothetical protein L3X38_036624 [Prunus dulcis]
MKATHPKIRGVSIKTEGRGLCCASTCKGALKYTKRHAVDQVNCSDNSIIPVMARNISTNQKFSGCFKKMSILSFNNTILLRCLRISRLMDNSMLLEVSLKVMIDKFSTIV